MKTKDELAAAVYMNPHEKDQFRLHLQMQNKAKRAEQEREVEAFRHEQMLRRWEKGDSAKPSKVIYLSDMLEVVTPQPSAASRPPLVVTGFLGLEEAKAASASAKAKRKVVVDAPPVVRSTASADAPKEQKVPSRSAEKGALLLDGKPPARTSLIAAPASSLPQQHLTSTERKQGKQSLLRKRKPPTDVKYMVLRERQKVFEDLEAKLALLAQQTSGALPAAEMKEECPAQGEEPQEETQGTEDDHIEGNSEHSDGGGDEPVEVLVHGAEADPEAAPSAPQTAAPQPAAAVGVAKVRALIDAMGQRYAEAQRLRAAGDTAGCQLLLTKLAGMQRNVHSLMKRFAAKAAKATLSATTAADEAPTASAEIDAPEGEAAQEDHETAAIGAPLLTQACTASGPFLYFHPSLASAKVGQHPHAHFVDRRTGRKPQDLPQEMVRSLDNGDVVGAQPSGALAVPAAGPQRRCLCGST